MNVCLRAVCSLGQQTHSVTRFGIRRVLMHLVFDRLLVGVPVRKP